MAYEVTATRRRPQSFDALVGQQFVAETLKNSLQAQKIAHAYLFSGPRGCGKTSTARILAKALNCEKGLTATPCGQCSACKEIAAGSSLDVIEIDGASNTSVNDVRQIKEEVVFPPNSCRYKIYIIDEVHMLSVSAFNALLKTIEEPPEYCVFIFATTELQKVPATIKSRCQQFNFRLVATDQIKEQLTLASRELGIEAEDEALFWIAREATGSMRDAYTLFDQVASFSEGQITFEKIQGKLGLVGIDGLNELFEACAGKDTAGALGKLDEWLQKGVSIEQLISNCTDYLRSVLLLQSGIKKESILGQSADRFSKTVIDAWSSVQVERGLDIFFRLYRDIRFSISPRYETELAISRLCWLSDYVSPAEVKKAAEGLAPLLAGEPKATSFSSFSSQKPQAIQSQAQRQFSSEKTSSPKPPRRVSSVGVPPIPTFSALGGHEEAAEDDLGAPEDAGDEATAEDTRGSAQGSPSHDEPAAANTAGGQALAPRGGRQAAEGAQKASAGVGGAGNARRTRDYPPEVEILRDAFDGTVEVGE